MCCQKAALCVGPEMDEPFFVYKRKTYTCVHKMKCFTLIPGQPNEKTLSANRIICAILHLLFDATTHQSCCLYTITHTRRAGGDRRSVAAASHTV